MSLPLQIHAIKRKDITEFTLKYCRVCSKHVITGKPTELIDRNNPDWVHSLLMGYGEDSKRVIKRVAINAARQERAEKIMKLDEQVLKNFVPIKMHDNRKSSLKKREDDTPVPINWSGSTTSTKSLFVDDKKNRSSDKSKIAYNFEDEEEEVDLQVDGRKSKFLTPDIDIAPFETKYDFLNRQNILGGKKRKLKYWRALVIYLNYYLHDYPFAAGFLFVKVGFVLTILFTFFSSSLMIINQHLLMKVCSKITTTKGHQVKADYGEAVRYVIGNGKERYRRFAKPFQIVVDVFICTTQILFLVNIFRQFLRETSMMKVEMKWTVNIYKLQVMIFTPLWLLSLLSDLKLQFPVQLFGFIIHFAYTFTSLIYLTHEVRGKTLMRMFPLNYGRAFLSIHDFFEYYEGLTILPYLKNELVSSEAMTIRLGVINVGMAISLIMIISFGFVSFRKYGDFISSSIIEEIPSQESLGGFIKIGSCFFKLCLLVLNLYIPVNVLLPRLFFYVRNKNGQLVTEVLLRAVIIVVVVTLPALPQLFHVVTDVVALAGDMFLNLVIPTFLYYVQDAGEQRIPKTVLMFFLLTLEIVALLLCTIGMIVELGG